MLLITGVPRSRTSMLAGMLKICGADFGPNNALVGANNGNHKGFYEHIKVRMKLQRPYFDKIGFIPTDREKLPSADDVIIDPEWRQRFEKLAPGVTAFKEPKICLYWEQWAYAFPEAKWVIVDRPREEILESVSKRTPWMVRNNLTQEQWNNWIDHHLTRLDQLQKRQKNHFIIDSTKILTGDLSELQRCVEWLGLTWRQNEVRRFIDPAATYTSSPGLLAADQPVLVVGCARSFTSLVAQTLYRHGIWFGECFNGNQFNPTGQFENVGLRGEMSKDYLNRIGCDPRCQNPLPEPEQIKIEADWRDRVLRIINNQGYYTGPWGYKDTKAANYWQVWNDAFPEARWIICRRKDSDIAQSCLNTSFMDAYDDEKMWVQWVERHLKRFDEIVETCRHVCEVWPVKAIHGDLGGLRRMVEFLGIRYNPEACDHINPDYCHYGR